MLLTVLLAVAAGGALLLLSRRWSEMPAPSPPHPLPAPPPRLADASSRTTATPRAGGPAGLPEQDHTPDDWLDEEEAAGDLLSLEMPDRMPIDHPILVKAASQADESGGGRRYFSREGDVLYFNLAALADPQERARAFSILLGLHEVPGAEPAGIADVMWLLRRIAND